MTASVVSTSLWQCESSTQRWAWVQVTESAEWDPLCKEHTTVDRAPILGMWNLTDWLERRQQPEKHRQPMSETTLEPWRRSTERSPEPNSADKVDVIYDGQRHITVSLSKHLTLICQQLVYCGVDVASDWSVACIVLFCLYLNARNCWSLLRQLPNNKCHSGCFQSWLKWQMVLVSACHWTPLLLWV